MTATITPIDWPTRSRSRPTRYSSIVTASETLLSWCLMLLDQLDVVRSGHTIDVPTRTFPAAVTRAQDLLLERGYPTEFKEGGEKGFGCLVFA